MRAGRFPHPPDVLRPGEDTEVGVPMAYPEEWKAVKDGGSFVWVRINDSEGVSGLLLSTLAGAVERYLDEELDEGLEPKAERLPSME